MLWSQQLDIRTDLSTLRAAAPNLARQLDEVRAELDQPSQSRPNKVMAIETDTQPQSAPVGATEPAALAEHQIKLAHRWDALIEQVRALRGFERFLRPSTAQDLCCAAADGPVVMINGSRFRCDAILVTSAGTRVVALPTLTHTDTVDHANRYLDALQNFEHGPGSISAQVTLEQSITTTLEWLWDAIAAPVLQALDHITTPTDDQVWPRVWWCPTGPLTLLPLHAAGYHTDGTSRTVVDRVVSSYTPTLRALIQARATVPSANADTPDQRLLIVALPDTPGQCHLPNVARERDFLTTAFPGRHTLLRDAYGSRQAVQIALSRHAWAHFSCHGTQDLGAPSHGGIVLYDGALTIAELATVRHNMGELMFLSACKTATGGVVNLDEAISLSAALHHAGWRHVIGTLWSVWDDAAADITAGVYRHIRHDGRIDPQHTAEALHRATRQLRNTDRYRPSRWAPFIHTGP